MGYHLVEKVYRNVVGTSTTAQAVLAFLAFTADDQGVRKCFPSLEAIEAATHFKHTGIGNALNELREAQLLKWVSGGRVKGKGGRSLANEYTFNLPSKRPSDGKGAVTAKRLLQSPRGGNCTYRDAVTALTATRQPSYTNQTLFQPSVSPDTEAPTDDLKVKLAQSAIDWRAERPPVDSAVVERHKTEVRTLHAVVDEAMRACGDSSKDAKSRQMFSSTLLRRDMDQALDVIHRFASERRAGEHEKLKNPAGCLNRMLAQLPAVR